MNGFSLNYFNFIGIFFDPVLSPILLIPSKYPRPVRVLLVLACGALIGATIWLLEWPRVLDALNKSIRSQAFGVESPLYPWFIENLILWVTTAICFCN